MSEINVSGCCHNNSNDENGICEIYKVRCYQRHCYYKQLQHRKAENEGLQSLNDFNVQKIETLEAENEELKEMNYGLSEKFANVCGGCFEQELSEKYKQCLDEIEDLLTTCEKNNCKGCKYIKQCREIDTHSWILKKIKEVKGDD